MKVTIVPAQITTVEDRIAGKLGLNQLLLLVAPIFFDSALYVVLPPFFHSALYKLFVLLVVLMMCGLMAIRIKGKLMLLWLIILSRYALRPRYYVYDKNSIAMRHVQKELTTLEQSKIESEVLLKHRPFFAPLSTADTARVQALIENPAAHLSFVTTKRGGLHVLITEAKE